MAKPRGRSHTSLTETAALIVRELERLPGIKMIAPGQIVANAGRQSGVRYVTVVATRPGMELIITGQSTQKVAVHLAAGQTTDTVIAGLKDSKRLRHVSWRSRERKPGV